MAQAAAAALAALPGKSIDADLVARLSDFTGKTRRVLIELIGQRRIEAAATPLFKAADDTDPQIRAAALAALAPQSDRPTSRP